tara:strand:+ start:4684 stop:5391 length:708 start_codon:yes stop_codon:yes gene_type:complete
MKNFKNIRENSLHKLALINKMKKASPAAKKALEAPSRVDKNEDVKSADKKAETYTKGDGKTAVRMVSMDKKVMTSESSEPAQYEGYDITEISLDMLKKAITSPGTKSLHKAMKTDKVKNDIKKMRDRLAVRPTTKAALQAAYEEKDSRLAKAGVSGFNKAKKTPGHKTKSHIVVAKQGDKIKTIRFGQQGVSGAGAAPKTDKDKARKKSYYARHNAQDSSPDKMSARYWSHKEKW